MSIDSWREVDGDNTLALDWPINEHSEVWEIGGFEGRWVAQMVEKFNPHITIFEPQGWAVERLRGRFEDNPKVTIYPYGLWVETERLNMGDYFTDGASIMKASLHENIEEFKDVKDILSEAIVAREGIDVCLMNIEGAEFILIPYMVNNGLMPAFKYFWCQFHEFVGDSDKKYAVYDGIGKTHDVLWDHYPTAVAWERR